jgi:hypothetical protein
LVGAIGLDYDEGLSPARAHAFVMSVLVASASLLLGSFSVFLIRELRNRAAREVELAAERMKLQAVNSELIVSKERAEVANHAKVAIPRQYESRAQDASQCDPGFLSAHQG